MVGRDVRVAGLACVLVTMAAGVRAQTPGLLGEWESAAGAVLQVYGCEAGAAPKLCVKILRVEPHGGSIDTLNPDEKLRGRSLCGVAIGTGFQVKSESEAAAGHLYDPNSGKTYAGTMRIDGTLLKLRGSWGPFGRSETMKRFSGKVGGCGG